MDADVAPAVLEPGDEVLEALLGQRLAVLARFRVAVGEEGGRVVGLDASLLEGVARL